MITGVYLLRWPITNQGPVPYDSMLLDQNLDEIMLTAAEKQRAVVVQQITHPPITPGNASPGVGPVTMGPIEITIGPQTWPSLGYHKFASRQEATQWVAKRKGQIP